MGKKQFEKNSSLISGEVISILSGKANIKVDENEVVVDASLLPKSVGVGDVVVITVMRQDVYESLKEKKAKDLLNEILGS